MNSLTETKTETEMFVERKTETKTEKHKLKKLTETETEFIKRKISVLKKNFVFGRPLSFVAVYSRSQKELWLFMTGIRLFEAARRAIVFLTFVSVIVHQ